MRFQLEYLQLLPPRIGTITYLRSAMLRYLYQYSPDADDPPLSLTKKELVLFFY